MTHLQIPEHVAADLTRLAQRDQRSVQDVVTEAMNAYISLRFVEADLAATQKTRLQESKEQADRRDLLDEAQIEAFFDDWEQEAATR